MEMLEERCTPTTVTNLNDAGPGSLRQALFDTPAGGIVDFSPGLTGTIVLTSGELRIGTDLTIEGPGPDMLTISGNETSRVFEVTASVTVALSGLTVTDGSASEFGGGIDNAGTLTLTDCTISGNSAGAGNWDGDGGGIFNSGTLTVTGCTVSGNVATEGGGIYNEGTLRVSDSTLSGNVVSDPGFALGGAIYNGSHATLTVSDSTLSGNVARSGTGLAAGGGIYSEGTLTLRDSTLSGNNVSAGGIGGGVGGAILIQLYSGMVIISECNISGNSASGTGLAAGIGGGIESQGTTVSITGSTISGNSASTKGGGIQNDLTAGTMPVLVNTIVAGDTAPSAPDVDGIFTSLGHNLTGQTDGSMGWLASDLTGTSAAPLDPLLGPLQDNGGPTETMALLPGSPALNAGDPGQLGTADQRGVVRTGGVNIGAYQASATAFLVSAPGAVQVGVPFDVTVTAVDPFGQVAGGYTGTVTFSTTDPDAGVVLPQDYTFQPEDNGAATLSRQTALATPGEQTIFVTDGNGVLGSITITVL
jgi:hypothetical protein